MIFHSFSRALAAASILVLIAPTLAQVDAVKCSVASYNWARNSLGQDPCLMSAYALAACNDGTANVTGLDNPKGGSVYSGPSGPDNGDICKCNTVSYSLISACGACQGADWLAYVAFTENCTSLTPEGQWPSSESFPAGTAFPAWSFLNLTSGTWDNVTAFQYSRTNTSEVSRPTETSSGSITSGTPVPTQSRGAPGATHTTSSNNSSSSHSTNIGAIVGGVVGGVGAIVLIGGSIWYLVYRSRRNATAPSALYLSGNNNNNNGMGGAGYVTTPTKMPEPVFYQPNGMGAPVTVPVTQKLYDPSDPSTFPDAGRSMGAPHPSTSPGPTVSTTHQTPPAWGSTADMNHAYYRGLPEL